MESDLHVVVGATGGTGAALARELVRRGHRVRAVSRGGGGDQNGVEAVTGDATDAGRMREVCAGAAAVYNCVNPPFDRWREAFPAAVRGTLAGAAAAGARLVFADDTWMYGRVHAPMTEATPVRPVSAKGVLRAWLAEMVLAAHARGDCPTVVARAGELYGPGVDSVLGPALFGAAAAGRPPRWIGALDRPLTPSFVEDFARVLATLGEAPADDLGRVWHVPHPAPTTGREFVAEIRRRTGCRAPLVRVGSRAARSLGLVWPLAREGAELVYQFEMPFVVDGSAFAARFGFTPTPCAEGIARTLGLAADSPVAVPA
ncbi:NAD-dependent epimerase/dehydratase family protein [Pseudonocardia halophobica]|uniref:NAD-dependent epimerase/dehydratase family protein n=1 Tax=Pseudonocardia halophobica TaxID=29401 RepID=UPI003D8DF130